MKRAFLQTSLAGKVGLVLALCLLSLLVLPQASRACNRSYVQLDSVVPVAATGEWDIYVTACVGAGITGSQKGAGGNTHTFAFVFYSSCVSSVTISDFPSSVKGEVTGAAYLGLNYGPVGSPFNAQGAILYLNPSWEPFVCVNSTAACGNIHTQCDQYRFRVAEMPDSLRVLGFEGGGNSMAGCYMAADMMVTLPAEGNPCNRMVGGAVSPRPVTAQLVPEADHFFPASPEAAVVRPALSLYPNPNKGVFTLDCADPAVREARVTILDLAGREVAQLRAVSMGETLDLGQLPAGSYFLKASGEGWQSSRMFVVQ